MLITDMQSDKTKNILQNILQKVDLTSTEIDILCTALEYRKIKKGKHILSEGNIPDMVFYIDSGLFRMYTTGDDFEEYTFEFNAENQWIADLECFSKKLPTSMNIEALEDSEILIIRYDKALELHQKIPRFTQFSRMHAEEKYIVIFKRNKLLSQKGLTTERRYLAFLENYPNLAHRIPSIHLASYLGVSPETFSRVKKALRKK